MLKFNKLQPTQYVVLGFFLVILTGSILLVLPFMHMKGAHVSYIDWWIRGDVSRSGVYFNDA